MTQTISHFFQSLKYHYNRIFHREATLTNETAIQTGIRIENQNVDFSFSARMTHCLVNALLLFCCVFGTIASFSSAFNIEYNELLLIIIFALLACFISCMNYRQLTQNLGYFFLFIVFCFFVITYRSYINSGFNGVLNDFYARAAIILDLDAVRTFSEQYEDLHYITVTVFYLTAGFVVMLLLNFTFNNEQNPFTVFVILFPFLQIGFYFDETPGPMIFVLLSLALLCCLIYRFNRQFMLTPQKRKSMRFHTKTTHSYMQYSSGKVMMQVAAVMMAFLLAFSGIISVMIPSQYFSLRTSMEPLKKNTEETVKQFLMYGLRSFFPNMGASGGLGYGELGQVGSVTPDFETDLTVTFAPYAYNTIYLKAYVGVNYRGDRWTSVTPQEQLLSGTYGYSGYEEIINLEAAQLATLREEDRSILKGKMRVQINDPALGEYFYPYYSLFDADSPYYKLSNELIPTPHIMDSYAGYLPYYSFSQEQEYEYYVMQDVWSRVDMTKDISTMYDRYVHDNYLGIWGGEVTDSFISTSYNSLEPIPDTHNIAVQLTALCAEQGFGGSTYEIVTQVRNFLNENYTYSLNPGRLPNGADFVTHFLFENPNGYCSYFATAATLLFRTMGIPARYVEGYTLTMSNVLDGEFLDDENYEDWLEGDANIGKTAVIMTEINDSQAHAWVEVYINGFGWIPVEVTPAASNVNDDDTDYDNFWNRLVSGNDGQGNAALNTLLSNNLSDIGSFIGNVLLVILAGFLLLLLIQSIRRYYHDRKSKKVFYSGYSVPILRQYQNLCHLLQLLTLSDTANLLPSSAKAILLKQACLQDAHSYSEELISLYQTAAYSDQRISQEDYRAWQQNYSHVTKPLLKQLSLKKRLQYVLDYIQENYL